MTCTTNSVHIVIVVWIILFLAKKKRKKKDVPRHRVALEALTKVEAKLRKRPVCECIKVTQLFIERKKKRVERARDTTMRARAALAAAVANQEQEVLLADGERRLAELVIEEKRTPSPFTMEPPQMEPQVEADQAEAGCHCELSKESSQKCGASGPAVPDKAEDDDELLSALALSLPWLSLSLPWLSLPWLSLSLPWLSLFLSLACSLFLAHSLSLARSFSP